MMVMGYGVNSRTIPVHRLLSQINLGGGDGREMSQEDYHHLDICYSKLLALLIFFSLHLYII